MVTDLCSIGTLFAFVLVCAGVLVLQNKKDIPRGKFKTPYVNSKFVLPILILIGLLVSFVKFKADTMNFITNEKQIKEPTEFITSIGESGTKKVYDFLIVRNYSEVKPTDLEQMLSKYYENEQQYKNVIDSLPVDDSLKYESGFSLFKHKIPMWIFLLSLIGLVVWAWKQNLSLIPLLGLICCLYMMAQLSIWNWIYFTCWLLIGLSIYFGFSYRNSKLNNKIEA